MAPLYHMPDPSRPNAIPAPQRRMLGSGQEMGQLPPVECTYANCSMRFQTIKDMQRHKRYEKEHNYCRRCDVDCESWDDLLKHKVDLMTFWMYDEDFRESDEGQKGPKHIVCEFCSVDFETFGGRTLHREQMHKAEQNISCPGCKERFSRASEMICHLEGGECEEITREEFTRAVMTKHILKQIMEDPAEFQENMSHNKGVIERMPSPPAGFLSEASSDRTARESDFGDDQSMKEGGVSLLGVDQVDLLEDAPAAREKLKNWPRVPVISSASVTESLPTKSSPSVTDGLRSMSIRSPPASVVDSQISVVTKRRAGLAKQYETAFPALGSASTATSTTGSVRSDKPNQHSVWRTPTASLALYRDDKHTDASQALTRAYDNATDQFDHTSNLLYHRFWDAGTIDFDGDMFLNVVIDRYCCPFPGCQAEFEDEEGIQTHLLHNHVTKKFRCPGSACMKIFGSATALVAHTEMSNKCLARRDKSYKAALDEITGGFLKARSVQVARVVDTSKAMVIGGQPAYGVTDVKYIAKRPDQHYE